MILDQLLKIPFVYNLRSLVAGDQFQTVDYIKQMLKKYKCHNVIDICCGTGDFCVLFDPKSYLGLDINPDYIEFARQKYPFHFEACDVTKYRFTKTYDCAIMISTLHHLSDKEVRSILKSLADKIKKAIIIVDLNPDTDLVRKFLIDHDRGDHVRTTEQKIKLLSKFGQVENVAHFYTRLASQTGLVLIPDEQNRQTN